MTGVLRNLDPESSSLRTKEVRLSFNGLPTVGQSFRGIAEALDEDIRALGGLRYVVTSPVTEVSELPEGYVFTTKNSTYELTIEEAP